MKIDGLVSETISQANGERIRLYPAGRSKQKFIRIDRSKTGPVSVQLIEGAHPPGLDEGEKVDLAHYDESIVERVVRAMASRHLGMHDLENAYTDIDGEMLARGFGIRFARNGSPHWSRCENGLTYEVAKPGGEGLPGHSAYELQAKVVAPFNASVVVVAPNLGSLMTFVDMKDFLGEMQPNTQSTFTLVEATCH